MIMKEDNCNKNTNNNNNIVCKPPEATEESHEHYDTQNQIIHQIPQSTRQITKTVFNKIIEDNDKEQSYHTMNKVKSSGELSTMLRKEFINTIEQETLTKENNNDINMLLKSASDNQLEQGNNCLSNGSLEKPRILLGKNDKGKKKTSKRESFLDRMTMDLYKRRTKEERMNILIEKNKVRHTEQERVMRFNRLIDDANRRFEAKEKMEVMKTQITDDAQSNTGVLKKTYDNGKWNEIYQERFEKCHSQYKEKLKSKQMELIKKKQEDEEKEVLSIKETTKKVPKDKVNKICQRLYEDGRKVFAVKDNMLNTNDDKNNNNHNGNHPNPIPNPNTQPQSNPQPNPDTNPDNQEQIDEKNEDKLPINNIPLKVIAKRPHIKVTNSKDKSLIHNKSNKACSIKTSNYYDNYYNSTNSNLPEYKNAAFRIKTEYDHKPAIKPKVTKPSIKKPQKINQFNLVTPKETQSFDIDSIEHNFLSSFTKHNLPSSTNSQLPNDQLKSPKSSNDFNINEIKQLKINKSSTHIKDIKTRNQCRLIIKDIDADRIVETVLKKTVNH